MTTIKRPATAEMSRMKAIMLERHLKGRDIRDAKVLAAMEATPRELFVDSSHQDMAYDDCPLPLGCGQTISQPYIVALMAQTLQIPQGAAVLEIGAGSGYQAAVLSRLAGWVYTVEIIEELALQAEKRLRDIGCGNVTVIHADGSRGWPGRAPYSRIIAAAAPSRVPPALEEQLEEGGRIVIPVGGLEMQDLLLGIKAGGRVNYETVTSVRFVPMTGDAHKP
jgi:protein-L-isoaspartate(D-aspartate) O-methyltransferase